MKTLQLGVNLLSVRSNEYISGCSFHQTNTYAVDGKKIREERKPGCALRGHEEDFHDGRGKVIERIIYGEGNHVTKRIKFLYSISGNLGEAYFYDEDGELESRVIYSYHYDSKGNWIERIGYASSDNPKQRYAYYAVECRNIEYYE